MTLFPASIYTLCDRYELKVDNAILAEEKHLPLYKELVDSYKVRMCACICRHVFMYSYLMDVTHLHQTPHAASLSIYVP